MQRDLGTLQSPFRWEGRRPRQLVDEKGVPILDPDAEPEEPIYESRFSGPLALKARVLRMMMKVGVPPPIAREMRITEIAAICQLDEIDAVLGEGGPIVPRAAENVPAPELRPVDTSIPRSERLKDYIAVEVSAGATEAQAIDTRPRRERLHVVEERRIDDGRR